MSRIAAFKMVGSSYWTSYWSDTDGKEGTIDGYVRTSEWVDVRFPPRIDSTVPEEVAHLDAKLEELKADFAKKVTAIETAKANLLALSDQRVSA